MLVLYYENTKTRCDFVGGEEDVSLNGIGKIRGIKSFQWLLVLSGTVAYAYIPDIDVTCSNGHDFTLGGSSFDPITTTDKGSTCLLYGRYTGKCPHSRVQVTKTMYVETPHSYTIVDGNIAECVYCGKQVNLPK